MRTPLERQGTDDVELQLHVASRRTTACQKVVEAAEDECFTISGNLPEQGFRWSDSGGLLTEQT